METHRRNKVGRERGEDSRELLHGRGYSLAPSNAEIQNLSYLPPKTFFFFRLLHPPFVSLSSTLHPSLSLFLHAPTTTLEGFSGERRSARAQRFPWLHVHRSGHHLRAGWKGGRQEWLHHPNPHSHHAQRRCVGWQEGWWGGVLIGRKSGGVVCWLAGRGGVMVCWLAGRGGVMVCLLGLKGCFEGREDVFMVKL